MRIAQHETAIDSYREHTGNGNASAQRNRILNFITDHGGNWSIGELAQAMGYEKSTISGRVNELLYQTKELEEKLKRKDRVSGKTVRPVGLPAVQKELFASTTPA